MSVQNIFLGNGLEHNQDRLNLDLISEAILAFLHGYSKREEHVFNIVEGEDWTPIVEREKSAMPFPCTPVTIAHGTIHCHSPNCFPHKVSKTLDFSPRGTNANCHTCCCGSRNAISKAETNSWSDYTGLSD